MKNNNDTSRDEHQHNFQSIHVPGLKICVEQCSVCGAFDAEDMQDQIDQHTKTMCERATGKSQLTDSLKASYEARIAELETQLKVVDDFAQVLAQLQKEGE